MLFWRLYIHSGTEMERSCGRIVTGIVVQVGGLAEAKLYTANKLY